MRLLLLCLFAFSLGGCHDTSSTQQRYTSEASQLATAVRPTANGFELLRHGKPYFIEGAGGVRYFDRLKACGGNSIRIWDDNDAERVLDEAQKLGLTVMLGLWVERETEGFDYNNGEAIQKQQERIRQTVLKYRNHPALLMWCVGNEVGLYATNLHAYDEMNRLMQMVHKLDPAHPVTTALSLDSSREVWLLRERCPDLDILSVNVYGEIGKLPQMLQEGGWTGPYIFSEYGAKGFWGESGTSPWVTPIEPTSQEKYDFVKQAYQQHIGSRPPKCLGSYFFYWGNKQEETSTWFSAFDETGRESAMVGLMQELWTGTSPRNRAPIIKALRVNGQSMPFREFTASSTVQHADVLVTDPDGDTLTYHWEIKPQAQQKAHFMGTAMPPIEGLMRSPANGQRLSFVLPSAPGPYRLFVFAYDQHNHVATANLTFRVVKGD
ncbi:glycoside hydrolase family 2 TIM barrel-domain containing protein [Fibrella sp. WM1]|uniref:glycoside hydrolase family 2 TIM barrel-domain containing protein n=1 Tax=Fibrella musci TaxID=3242485 RepID=UPI003521CE2C